MMTGKEDLMQAMIEAYLMEKGTRDFYSRASSLAAAPEARKMFSDLSAWEGQHMSFIQFLYQAVQGDRDMIGFEKFKDSADASFTEAGIPVKDLDSRLEKYEFASEREAFALALEIEGKAYNLYRRLSEGAADQNAKIVFQEMMEQEKKHIDYLKKLKL